LRILGIDTLYERDVPDERILKLAKKSGRILFTRDMGLYKVALRRGINAFFISGKSEAERLAEFSKKFKVRLTVSAKKSRCAKCNHQVVTVRKEEVKDRVPVTTFKAYRRFWMCPSCRQVYWMGPHWKRMGDIIKRANDIVKRGG
jgi:hypothetical protein